MMSGRNSSRTAWWAIAPPAIDVDAMIELAAQRTPPLGPLGDPTSTRLGLGTAHARLRARGPVDNAEFRIEIVVDSGQIIIDVGEGDDFLQSVFGDEPQQFDFKPNVAWSSRTGFSIQGQSALAANLPVYFSLAGILTVDTIYVAITGKPDAAALAIAVSGRLNIGPVTAEIKHIGIQLLAYPKDSTKPGNLGLLDLGFGFKSPERSRPTDRRRAYRWWWIYWLRWRQEGVQRGHSASAAGIPDQCDRDPGHDSS